MTAGASGIYFAEILNRLRIADEINAKATIIEKGFIANAVVDGRADVTEFSAALALEAVENAEARAFIEFLTSAKANEAYGQTLLEIPVA